ncbi:MAG: hypothetical protein JRN68_03265 [Nitrososphaerota archaeon]|nr:hypothetical protein [Ferrimicrobium acidiphilum]MDG6933697.1 hypothetical protein [Nitrososphaerota archaeon]
MKERTIEGAIKSIVTSEETYALLPNGTWLAGGCGILAEAILKVWTCAGAELYIVKDLKNGVVHHILIHLGRYYYDGNGKSTKKQLLHHWKYEERLAKPVVEPLKEWPEDIDRDGRTSTTIAQMLTNYYYSDFNGYNE